MYERSIVHLPFPPSSTITTDMVKQISAIDDFSITYSDKDMTWTELAIKNLDYMIEFATSLGSNTAELEEQREKLRRFIASKKH